jgi:hypothetical protein
MFRYSVVLRMTILKRSITSPAASGAASTDLGVGAVYRVGRHWALMASGGPGLERPGRTKTSEFYVSLQITR